MSLLEALAHDVRKECISGRRYAKYVCVLTSTGYRAETRISRQALVTRARRVGFLNHTPLGTLHRTPRRPSYVQHSAQKCDE